MYIPAHFKVPHPEELHQVITERPLGVLITHGPSGLDANHLPFEFDPRVGEQGTLRAHVARANPVWKDIQNGDEVLVVFRAEEAYISPNWYPSKHESHQQVPTWNYKVVHAYGSIIIRDDEKYVRGLVARLTRTHEASQRVPWKMGDAPKEYIDGELKEIIGLEISITYLAGKFKLGQNHELRDRMSAGNALKEQGNALGRAMLDAIDSSKP